MGRELPRSSKEPVEATPAPCITNKVREKGADAERSSSQTRVLGRKENGEPSSAFVIILVKGLGVY